jgi:hypothetical protein
MRHFLRLLFLLCANMASGAPESPVIVAAVPPSTITVTAELLSPTDIEVKWNDRGSAAQGYVVEWTTDPATDYVVLAYLPAHVSSYQHRDLMPETTCHYRVRAVYGLPSAAVPVELPKSLPEDEYVTRMEGSEDYSWAVPAILPGPSPIARKSLRAPETAAAAAPNNLTVTLMPVTVSGFKATWTDRASDEEGYLLEMKTEGGDDYVVCAVLDPDINTIGYALAPPHRKALVRVRAYYFGPSSNLVSRISGRTTE